MSSELSDTLASRIVEAVDSNQPLNITGAGTKAELGRAISGNTLSVKDHSGIQHYEPTELVITARAGTCLEELENTLAAQKQMLAFEPPHFGAYATLGGTIACGLAGPRRPWTGAARDFVLGAEIINGKGEILRFGGEVMKNVAGYDISRLMAGSWGTLGVISSVSLKVLPAPDTEVTRVRTMAASDAIRSLAVWSRSPLPISGAVWIDGQLMVRFSGTENAVTAACQAIDGDALDNADEFWRAIREHAHSFFSGGKTLWRLGVPRATPWLDLSGDQLIDWGGAQRWLKSSADEQSIRAAVAAAGGHATRFRGGDRTGQVFHPIPSTLRQLHSRLKAAFDPHSILNPGRMYEGL